MQSLRFRGLEDGGLGGNEHFILVAGDCEGFWSDGGGIEFRSDGGAFSLETICLREEDGGGDGFDLLELGFGDCDGDSPLACASLKIVFLGCIKCFIVEILQTTHTERERERGGFGQGSDREGGAEERRSSKRVEREKCSR